MIWLLSILSTKIDNYENPISYFKIVDANSRSKLEPLFSLNDDSLKRLFLETEAKGEYILKVKETFVNPLNELVKMNIMWQALALNIIIWKHKV